MLRKLECNRGPIFKVVLEVLALGKVPCHKSSDPVTFFQVKCGVVLAAVAVFPCCCCSFFPLLLQFFLPAVAVAVAVVLAAIVVFLAAVVVVLAAVAVALAVALAVAHTVVFALALCNCIPSLTLAVSSEPHCSCVVQLQPTPTLVTPECCSLAMALRQPK